MSSVISAPELRKQLVEGIQALDVDVSESVTDTLIDYVGLLHKWNKAFNLTAIRDPSAMIGRHVLDSLSILPWVQGSRILDIGSGAGIPGIILAIVRPDLQVSLLDSNGKKVRFQQQAVLELGLNNVIPLHSRVEEFKDEQGFDQIVSRAFASVDTFVSISRSLIHPDGEWLAMIGRIDSALDIPDDVQETQRIKLEVPGEEGERHLLRLVPKVNA